MGVGGKCGSRQGVVGRSHRPRARDTSDRRRIRGRKESGTSKAELRQARARSRNSCMRWGAAHPRAASLFWSAFPWANGSSEFVRAGIQKMEIELSRFTWSRRGLMRAIICVGNRLDGAGREQFDAVETVGDKIVAR